MRRHLRQIGRVRRGAAVVEMAVVTPVLLLLLLGTIEFGWLFHVKQSMTTASRVGARTASMAGTTNTEVTTDIDNSMSGMGLSKNKFQYTITITRGTTQNPYEKVEIVMPYTNNLSLLGGFFNWLNIQQLKAETTFRREVLGTSGS